MYSKLNFRPKFKSMQKIKLLFIALPSELDSTAVTSILDYLHGFQLQTPPDEAVDDLYAAASYFNLFDLKFQIVTAFHRKIDKSQFKAIDDYTRRLAAPKFYSSDYRITDVAQLPAL